MTKNSSVALVTGGTSGIGRAVANKLAQLGVHAINVPDSPRASARMSAQSLCIQIQQHTGIETILHYTCRDRNVLSIQSDLLGASSIGLHNILCLTGDPPKLGNYPDATAVFDVDAIGLVNIVRRLNHGLDIGSNSIRLVVYEGLLRAPAPLFQEKALCGLGRYLNSTGRLNEETIPDALASLARFAKLAQICGVRQRDLHPFATAAVRWAEERGRVRLARALSARSRRRCRTAVRRRRSPNGRASRRHRIPRPAGQNNRR